MRAILQLYLSCKLVNKTDWSEQTMTLDQLHELQIRNCKGQQERLLYWFNNISKTITPLQSWQSLGIYRLADVVLKLRKKGFQIATAETELNNRFQEPVQFAIYEFKGD